MDARTFIGFAGSLLGLVGGAYGLGVTIERDTVHAKVNMHIADSDRQHSAFERTLADVKGSADAAQQSAANAESAAKATQEAVQSIAGGIHAARGKR